MKIQKCRECGLDVARTKTPKGKPVVCDVYWDGEFKMYEKNRQPIPHRCTSSERRKK